MSEVSTEAEVVFPENRLRRTIILSLCQSRFDKRNCEKMAVCLRRNSLLNVSQLWRDSALR
jgi:hypothetical protein